MLKSINAKTYKAFAYPRLQKLEYSSYPLYCDGIKTEEDFRNRVDASESNPHEHLFIYMMDDVSCGAVHYYALPNDHYVSVHSWVCEGHVTSMLDSCLEFLKHHYPGFTFGIGYPQDNEKAIKAIRDVGFHFIEESVNMTCKIQETVWEPKGQVVQIDAHNYEMFAKLHQNHDAQMYWNVARIQENLERWDVFGVVANEQLSTALYAINLKTMIEIFGIDYSSVRDNDAYINLMNYYGEYLKQKGHKHLVYFAPLDEVSLLTSVGFKSWGTYRYYTIKL